MAYAYSGMLCVMAIGMLVVSFWVIRTYPGFFFPPTPRHCGYTGGVFVSAPDDLAGG